jgi:NAD(P)-dependent dehydrogenase (short-subunit alcohol dehydrogenase family)
VTAEPGGRLTGRVAVVTGAAAGLGLGMARQLARHGASVVIADRNAAAGAAAARSITAELGGTCRFVLADVSVREEVRRLIGETIEAFGRIDVLINNAQNFTPWVPLDEKTDEMFEESLRTGLWGTLWAMRATFPHMRAQGCGSIINLASVNGTLGVANGSDYNTTKEAIRGLTRSAAQDWGVHGIRVNCIEPNGLSSAWAALASDPAALAERAALLPLRRIGDPEWDIGPAVVFLASDDSRYVTGTTLHVDGGTHIRMSRPAVRATRPDGHGHYVPGSDVEEHPPAGGSA